jgi:polar amino acid transport system permease protein
MTESAQPSGGGTGHILGKIPGAEPSAKIDAWWGLVIFAAVITLALVLISPDPYRRLLFFVRDGVWVTIRLTVIAFIFTLILGLIGGLGRLSSNRLIYGISTFYVELVRGIPLLVQLLWWYYAFPVLIQNLGRMINSEGLIHYQANGFFMAVLGFVVCYGAYMSEIYRAGIQSIPRGQMEAARSLGMSYFQAMRYIILPQAVRVILPPVGNEFIALLKDSSLVSVVAVADLTRRSREFMSANFNPIETWIFAALLYLIMTLLSARVVNYIEKKTRIER